MKTRKSPSVWKLCSLSLTLAAALGAAPAGAASPERVTHRAEGRKVGLKDAGGAYDHPALLTRAEATDLLAALRCSRAETFRWGDPEPIFSRAEAEALAQPVADALAKASPRDRVFFSLDRPTTKMLAFASSEITRGELYVKGGAANVAFAAVAADPEALPGSDLDPFAAFSHPDWRVEPAYGQSLGAEGRDNWLALPLRAGSALASAAAPGATATDAARSAGGEPDRLAQAEPAPAASAGGKRSIEGRLRLLQALKQEGLLTDAEHRAKYEGVVRDLRASREGDPVGLLKEMKGLAAKGLLDAQDYEGARRAILQDL